MGRVIVVGAGLSGLVAAERLSAGGRDVTVLEASPKAGGRCRSYHDARLNRQIDNGNHLILSANRAVLGWARRIGGSGGLHVSDRATFPFMDLADGRRWALTMASGPKGALRRAARPPGVGPGTMAAQVARLCLARRGQSVAETLPDRGALWHGFWDPMTRAILNADPAVADAGLLRATMLRSFARGADACRPVLAPNGLGPALIDPALDVLSDRGVALRMRMPVRGIALDVDRATALILDDGTIPLGPDDGLVLAMPPQAIAGLLPDLTLPGPGQPIANAHFVVPGNGLPPILGLLGGAAQWLFTRGDVVSATVSAADASPLAGLSRDAALAVLWDEVASAVRVHGGPVPGAMPAARLLRERAATFDQSTTGVARRHGTRTRWCNVVLAGDHVATGLPATLEGAVLSGERAAAMLGARDKGRRWRP